MGSNSSSIINKESPLLFSAFYRISKAQNRPAFSRDSISQQEMETLVHLWYVNCLSKGKWNSLMPRLRNRVMQDFIDTVFCFCKSFDEIFLMLFTNAKSRYFILYHSKQVGLSCEDLRGLVEDILRYASLTGLRYNHYQNMQKHEEDLIDYPLKTFSLCPCTRRPLYVAMYLSRPDIVRLLLNCGARIPYEDMCHCANDQRHPLKNVMDVMKTPLETTLDQNELNCTFPHREKSALSLRLLLVDLSYTSPLWKNVCEVIEALGGQKGTNRVPSLKEMSRYRIRSIMKSKRSFYELNVLKTLGLPSSLISYINIED